MGMSIGYMLAYVRYRQVAEHLSEDSVNTDRLNKAALVAGVLSAFGFTLIGHFPVCCLVVVYRKARGYAYAKIE